MEPAISAEVNKVYAPIKNIPDEVKVQTAISCIVAGGARGGGMAGAAVRSIQDNALKEQTENLCFEKLKEKDASAPETYDASKAFLYGLVAEIPLDNSTAFTLED